MYPPRYLLKKNLLLKHNKSAGVDNLPPGMLKDLTKQISLPLCHIINFSIKTSTFLNLSKQAKVIPVYKSDPTETPDNYRTVRCYFLLQRHILEKAVHSQFISFLETDCLLSKHKFG